MTTEFPVVINLAITFFAVFLIGISKAGFGGGVGLLTTPLLSLIYPAKFAVGFLLPLLIVADVFTLYHHRGHWDIANLKRLIPASIVGILAGSFFMHSISDFYLKKFIGVVVLIFVMVHLFRLIQSVEDNQVKPRGWVGGLVGVAAGFVSTAAHSAGAIIAMYLLPQKLSKRVFVSTMVLFFALVNLFKVIPYISIQLITIESLKAGIWFIPLIPLGTLTGAWLNKRISQAAFTRIILILVLITGIQLLLDKNIFTLLLR
ncbi:TSUP family transporter [candidate division KSB1 bacterium]|nr:TSUP family transporter [candidate division KSB1 bacterium]